MVQPGHELGLEKQQGNVGRWLIRAARSVITRRARIRVQSCLALQEEAEISPCWVSQAGALCPWIADEPKEPPKWKLNWGQA